MMFHSILEAGGVPLKYRAKDILTRCAHTLAVVVHLRTLKDWHYDMPRAKSAAQKPLPRAATAFCVHSRPQLPQQNWGRRCEDQYAENLKTSIQSHVTG